MQWNTLITRGSLRKAKKLFELRDAGVWNDENDVPRDECGTPLLDYVENPSDG